MKKTICIILATAFAATLQAAVPLAWNVETTRAQPAAFDCYRGETLTLRASLYNAGTALDVSGAAASFYWQTNGMGEVYWSAPATAASNVLSATWAPTNDVGAASYNCFLGVAGEIYRAAFRIRMLPSPGAVPSELDLPAKSIDFAAVTVLNAPYYTQGEADSALASAAQSATNYVNAVAAGKQDTISDLAAIREGAELGATALQSYTESDPVWNTEKSGYATIRALAEGDIVPNRADKANYANLAGFASNAAELGDRSATAILGQLDDQTAQLSSLESRVSAASRASTNYTDSTAATLRASIEGKADATNTYTKAQMDAALAGKLDKSGGEVTGSISMVNGMLDAGDVQTRSLFDFLQPGQLVKSLDAPENSGKALTDADLQDSSSALGAALAGKADDADVVHTTGDETIGGVKTFGDGGVMVDNSEIGMSMSLVAGGVLVTAGGESAYFYVPAASGGGGTFALLSDVMLKADRASNYTPGNLAELSANGDPVDSGKSAADFAAAGDLAAAAVSATNYTDAATNAIPKFSEKDVVKVYFKDGENFPSYIDGRGELWEIGDLELGGHWVATGGPASSQGTYNYAGHTGGTYGWTLEGNYITYNTSTGEIVHNGSTSTNTPEPGKNPEVIGTTFSTCSNIWTSGRTITYYPMAYQYVSKGRFALSNTLSKVAFTGNYNDLTGKPTFATVATSGSYNDLTDKPTIPSPTAPVASATLAWQSNGSAIVVSVGAAGTLSATLTGWIEGQTQTALITIAAGASVSSEVKLVGYGTWPTGGQFLASATRVGNNVYVTPIVLVN